MLFQRDILQVGVTILWTQMRLPFLKEGIKYCKERMCGNKAQCYPKRSSYICICTQGKEASERPCIDIQCPSNQQNMTVKECSPELEQGNQEIHKKRDNKFLCSIYDLASSINNDCHKYKKGNSSKLLLMNVSHEINQIMKGDGKWQEMGQYHRRKAGYLLTEALESTMKMTVVNMDKEKYNLTMDYLDLQIQVLKNENISVNGTVILSAKEDQIKFHWETKKSISHSDFAAISFIACRQMGSLLGVNELEMENKKFGKEHLELNSNLLMAIMTSSNQSLQNATFIIKNKKEDNIDDYTICVFLRKTKDRIFWSTAGCTKVSSNHSHTICNCRHLSNFAVLVALYKVEDPALNTITYIGIISSLVTLLTAIITFLLCRTIQSPRTSIHTHLCLCLFFAELLFLIGISKTENKAICGAIAGILHYLFLACFMWMLLEGFQLYLMVVKVFQAQSLQGMYTYPVAYGIPALIVIVSAAVYPQGYGTREHCWLAMEKGFKWSFLVPLCAICLVNIVFLTLTIWKLIQKFNSISPDLPFLQKIRRFIVTAIAQLTVLGCAWIFGVFHFQKRTIALAYIFTILNSFQGTFIFILHCVNNKQVRNEYRKWTAYFCKTLKIQKYSIFSDLTHPSSSSHVGNSATSM
ncbi:adhesion G protein-coupled receptor E5-like isoform X2 [Narcine bancroftii]|uniref:adhesion G protein-coupled receptor E5-like isoform X2 n=1 Tax=Narcine bancroftii TaxID=1343680 RepID=UPI0038321FC0